MKYIFLFLICIKANSLEIGERLKVRLTSIGPENVIWMNVGRTDHIVDREHVKIYKGDIFAARAISVRVNYNRSAWKVYRVVNPELINMNEGLTIKSIPVKDIAWEYLEKPLLHYRKIAVDFAIKDTRQRKHDEPFLRTHNLDPSTLQ